MKSGSITGDVCVCGHSGACLMEMRDSDAFESTSASASASASATNATAESARADQLGLLDSCEHVFHTSCIQVGGTGRAGRPTHSHKQGRRASVLLLVCGVWGVGCISVGAPRRLLAHRLVDRLGRVCGRESISVSVRPSLCLPACSLVPPIVVCCLSASGPVAPSCPITRPTARTSTQ